MNQTHLIRLDEVGADALATVSAGVPARVTNRGGRARQRTIKGCFEQEFVHCGGKARKSIGPLAERSLPRLLALPSRALLAQSHEPFHPRVPPVLTVPFPSNCERINTLHRRSQSRCPCV